MRSRKKITVVANLHISSALWGHNELRDTSFVVEDWNTKMYKDPSVGIIMWCILGGGAKVINTRFLSTVVYNLMVTQNSLIAVIGSSELFSGEWDNDTKFTLKIIPVIGFSEII